MKASSTAKRPIRRPRPEPEVNPELAAFVERTKDELARLDKKARVGERLEGLWKDGAYQILNDEIFAPFEAEIINCLKSPNFDIENKGQLYQFQASLKAINEIRQRWQNKIQAGIEARTQFAQIQSTAQQEGA